MSLCRCFKILLCTFCTFYKNLHETLEILETLCCLSRSHLVRILNVSVWFLSLLYLVPFILACIVLVSYLYCTCILLVLSPTFTWSFLSIVSAAETFQIVYAPRIQFIYSYCTQNRRSHNQNQTIFANFDIFLPNKFAHIKYLLYLCGRKF